MINFLDETNGKISGIGKKWSDVIYIGTDPRHNPPYYSCTVDEFKRMANFNYDDGYGSARISTELMILFNDKSYLTRGEYDGAEWWEYTIPVSSVPKKTRSIVNLKGGGIDGLGRSDGW